VSIEQLRERLAQLKAQPLGWGTTITSTGVWLFELADINLRLAELLILEGLHAPSPMADVPSAAPPRRLQQEDSSREATGTPCGNRAAPNDDATTTTPE
jgi:hypothetical protein